MKGLHLTADLRGVDPGRLLMTDTTALATACGDAVRMAGLSGVAELMPVLFRDYRVRDVSVEEPEIEEVVRESMAVLEASPVLKDKIESGALKVVGAVYDLPTGKVNFLA